MNKTDLLLLWNDIKNKFPDLIFIEKTHQYFIKGERLPSVSSLIGDFYEHFDTEMQVMRYALDRKFSEKHVSSAWLGENKTSTDKGTKIHLFGESYAKFKYFGIGKEEPISFCKQSLGIVDFWNNLPSHIVPVALEIQMYHIEYGYCGTADVLLYDLNNDCFILADYKTNKELFGDLRYFKQMFNLRTKLNQDNFGKYSCQLSFYQIMLDAVGLNISERWIVFLQEDKENKKLYQIHKTEDLTEELKVWLGVKHKHKKYF